ncbi:MULTISPECIES: GlxA family transcriptional regulator [unclassified Aureimonas]|uniref:GlxA family transcriptional regulator n=1 Tax=unclassified Aureimonas TaxID=2615206 RepID=UPI000701BB8D|nr:MULTISPECIES: helix-turn-helix domain-containing protein [unclassified Aureimonas]KQT64087.1 AraC family transcriptional regulator [Aureimonas sp. Leaf427]KQT81277.1 AraC family transcriptional regulator [Aureimonas sp. Leaf460]
MAVTIFQPSEACLSIDILVLPELSLLSLASTLEPLRAANRVAGRTVYRWRLLSPDGAPVTSSSGVSLAVDGAFPAEAPGDAVFVVAAFDIERHATRPILAALRRLARAGVPLGGIEAGAWVLALAGLLEGRRATTHWEDLDAFAARFPGVAVLPSRFVLDLGKAGGDRFTTGGASPALDMMLELIRRRQGAPLALSVAGIFIYEEARAGEDPQPSLSLGRLDWNEPRVASAIRLMEARIERPVSIAALARAAGVAPRTLEALFQQAVGTSPREFYAGLRLEAGRRMVLETRADMASVAEGCGFASASAFARAFRRHYAESPTEARRTRRRL